MLISVVVYKEINAENSLAKCDYGLCQTVNESSFGCYLCVVSVRIVDRLSCGPYCGFAPT